MTGRHFLPLATFHSFLEEMVGNIADHGIPFPKWEKSYMSEHVRNLYVVLHRLWRKNFIAMQARPGGERNAGAGQGAAQLRDRYTSSARPFGETRVRGQGGRFRSAFAFPAPRPAGGGRRRYSLNATDFHFSENRRIIKKQTFDGSAFF